MKEYEVKIVFDLNNPEQANLYNSIRSLDGIKNAILDFKEILIKMKESGNEENHSFSLAQTELIEKHFIESFDRYGVNV